MDCYDCEGTGYCTDCNGLGLDEWGGFCCCSEGVCSRCQGTGEEDE